MNITLIGMPGAGKSTVGRIVAQRVGLTFLDIDAELEAKFQMPLQQILDSLTDEGFLQAEEALILSLGSVKDTLVSPGGSVIYSQRAMDFLKGIGHVVFIDVPLELVEQRIDAESRGIVRGRGQTIAEVYAERVPLYRKWADRIVAMEDVTTEENAERVLEELGLQ